MKQRVFMKDIEIATVMLFPIVNSRKPFLVVEDSKNHTFETEQLAVDFVKGLGYLEMIFDGNDRLVNEKEILESRLTND